MPTDDYLLDLDITKVRLMLNDVLNYRGREGLLLSLVIMYESLSVITSYEGGYSYTNNKSLFSVYRVGSAQLKYVRNCICHSMYNEAVIKDKIRGIVVDGVIKELYKRVVKQYSADAVDSYCMELLEYAKS